LSERAARLGELIGYRFSDEGLLETALRHRSAGRRHNERMEYLGDAVLGLVIAEALYQNYPDANEGQLSRLRAGLVRRDSLSAQAKRIRLGDYLELSPGELRSGGHGRASILADALEAIFGAVYLDGGFQAARAVILSTFGERLDALTPAHQEKDPKTRLQEYLQARQQPLPEYRVDSVSGSPHEQQFTVTCRVESFAKESTGTGSSRRRAEQHAADQLLKVLGDD
jgi:ribonuclease-3